MIKTKIVKVQNGTVRDLLREFKKADNEGYKFRRCIYIEQSKEHMIDAAYQYTAK